MVFQNNVIAGAAGSGTTVYEIEQSIRFNQADSAYMYKNFSGAGNKKTATWSFWCKRSDLGDRQDVISFAQDVPFIFQAEDGIRDVERSRGLGDVYKRQISVLAPNE